MKEIKIVDNLAEKTKKKSIELIYCLQASYNDKKLPEWCLIETPFYDSITKLTRVGKHPIGFDHYDVIITETSNDRTSFQNYWLGHWNDGVVENQ
jgi:hypothetical protein